MLEIKMVVAQCTTAELSATAAYLTALAAGRTAGGDTAVEVMARSERERAATAGRTGADAGSQEHWDRMQRAYAEKQARVSGATGTCGSTDGSHRRLPTGPSIQEQIDAKQPAEVGNMVVKLSVDNTQALAAINEVKQAAAPLPTSVADKLVATIDPLDLPDAGVDTMQSTPNRLDAPDPAFAAFREQAVGKVPPLPNAAPSTAAAAPPTTAPAAPPATSTPAQNVSSLPVPPVPAAAAPTAAPTSVVPVDKDGLPWDQRIHSESKAVNADKTWRKKRNVGPDKVAEVEAELRAVMGSVAAPAPTAKPDAAWPFPVPAAAATLPSIPVVAAAPVPAPPPAAASEDGPLEFADFMDAIVPLFTDDRLTMEQANVFAASVQPGLTISMLPNRPDLIRAVLDAILAAP